MKIVEKDGKQMVEFEEKDADLRANFLSEMEKMHMMSTEARQLSEQHDKIYTQLKVAMKKLELYKLENHDKIWGPVNEQLKKDLGVEEAPGMSYGDDGLTVINRNKRSHPLLDILGID